MDLVMLKPCRDAMEANLLCQLLRNEGIEATTMGEPLAAARGELPVTMETLPSLWVRQEDVERATATLEQLAAEAGQARLDEETDDLEDPPPARRAGSAWTSLLGAAVCLGLACWLGSLIADQVRGFDWPDSTAPDVAALAATVLLMSGGAVILLWLAFVIARGYLRRRQPAPPDQATPR